MKHILYPLFLIPILLHGQILSENNSRNISFHGKKITDNNIQSFQENKTEIYFSKNLELSHLQIFHANSKNHLEK